MNHEKPKPKLYYSWETLERWIDKTRPDLADQMNELTTEIDYRDGFKCLQDYENDDGVGEVATYLVKSLSLDEVDVLFLVD